MPTEGTAGESHSSRSGGCESQSTDLCSESNYIISIAIYYTAAIAELQNSIIIILYSIEWKKNYANFFGIFKHLFKPQIFSSRVNSYIPI